MSDEKALVPGAGNAMRERIKHQEAALRNQRWSGQLTPQEKKVAWHFAQAYGLDLNLRHLEILGGRPYVTVAGMLHIAHTTKENPLAGIELELEHGPSDDANEFEYKATVYRFINGQRVPFVEFGDANAGNVGLKNPEKFLRRVARTRATGRALRIAFAISTPAAEEMYDFDEAAPTVTQAALDAPEAEEPAAGAAKLDALIAPKSPVIDGGEGGRAESTGQAPATATGAGGRVEDAKKGKVLSDQTKAPPVIAVQVEKPPEGRLL